MPLEVHVQETTATMRYDIESTCSSCPTVSMTFLVLNRTLFPEDELQVDSIAYLIAAVVS